MGTFLLNYQRSDDQDLARSGKAGLCANTVFAGIWDRTALAGTTPTETLELRLHGCASVARSPGLPARLAALRRHRKMKLA